VSKETFADQIARLESMADGDATWDLSNNDRAAIRAILESWTRLWASANGATDIVQKFIRKHQIGCSETIYQCDRVSENALDFIFDLCEAVGYYQEVDGEAAPGKDGVL
jgi:hypothetical protein